MRVERYQRQVAEGQTPSAFLRSYDAGNTTAQIGAAWGQVGGALEKWGAWAQKRQDEWDAATVMNAQTEFARRMSDYLDNPDTGQTVTRKSGAARDLTKDTDAYADKTAQEISGLLENDRQRAVFNSGIPKAKMPFTRQASDYEARELQVFRKQAFDANIAAAQDMYLRAADSPADRERAVDMAANAIRSQYFGAPEEYIDLAIAEARSGMAAQWVSHVAQENPMTAMEMLNDKSLGLLPETRNKLEAQIKPRAEIYEVQDIVDGLAAQFPQGMEGAGLEYIRQKYEGPLEEKIASAYKMRMNELDIDQNNARRMRAQAQEDRWNEILSSYVETGLWPNEAEVQLMVANGEISPTRGAAMLDNKLVAKTRAQTEKRLSKDPAWVTLKPEQQEELVMREMGVTTEERKELLSYLWGGVLDGSVTDAEVRQWYANGRITKAEKERLINADKRMSVEQKAFVDQQKEELKVDFKNIKIPGKSDSIYQSNAETKFTELLRDLNPADKDYRKQVMEARKQALVYGVQQSGKALEQSWTLYKPWTWGGDGTTAFGERFNKQIRAIDQGIKRVQEYTPKFTMDNINLPEKRTPPAETPSSWSGSDNVGFDALGGAGTTIISDYMKQRKKDDGTVYSHGGIDIRGNKPGEINGKPVTAPMQLDGVKMTVSGVGKDSVSGNKLHLKGEYNGQTFDIFMCHFQNGSIQVKNGQTVTAGQTLAKVGSTGHSDGPHLHIETKINDKKVDPKRFYKLLGVPTVAERKKQMEQQQPAQQQPAVPEQSPAQVGKSSIADIFRNGVPNGWRGGRMF
jgi:murein DD-endopeptidase MepM/ murein hydrolase activator NlpD